MDSNILITGKVHWGEQKKHMCSPTIFSRMPDIFSRSYITGIYDLSPGDGISLGEIIFKYKVYESLHFFWG